MRFAGIRSSENLIAKQPYGHDSNEMPALARRCGNRRWVAGVSEQPALVGMVFIRCFHPQEVQKTKNLLKFLQKVEGILIMIEKQPRSQPLGSSSVAGINAACR